MYASHSASRAMFGVAHTRASSQRLSSARTQGRAHAVSTKTVGGWDDPVQLNNGSPSSGPDLSVTSNGMHFPNPFVIASGPPGTNYKVMQKAFDEGWGGVVCKTLTLDSSLIHNVTPRYARMKGPNGEVLAWENIELISDRPFETMLEDLKQLKHDYPEQVLIASIMEEYNQDAWEEIVGRCEEVGVDGFEINFSCPQGMPERHMGMAMGQDPEVLNQVCSWVDKCSTKPVWAKMTPNITNVAVPARAALDANMEGISAINTISSIMGINLETLRPQPCVEGYSTPGGYSGKAVKPIALAQCQAIAQLIQNEYAGERTLSGLGGVDRGADAAEFILLGATTVQVCTGVMVHGYSLVQNLCGGLQQFMELHGFKTLNNFRGASLPYFGLHSELFARQQEALKEKRKRVGLVNDGAWTGEGFVKETETMVSN